MAFSNYFQPATAALFGYDCPDLASMASFNEMVNATIDSDLTVTAVSSFTSELANATIAGCPTVSVNNMTENLAWACDPYIGQLIYVNCYGVTSAAYVLLTTLVLADLFGAEKFTNSFGLLLLFQGVATFGGPPIVGYMFDAFGSYNEGLILMGTFITLSGVMLYPIPCIRSTIDKRQRNALPAEPSIIKRQRNALPAEP